MVNYSRTSYNDHFRIGEGGGGGGEFKIERYRIVGNFSG